MTLRIHWFKENPGAAPDEGGYWTSSEGRFAIAPKFRHTVFPDSYELTEYPVSRPGRSPETRLSITYACDTVREAKAKALSILTIERARKA